MPRVRTCPSSSFWRGDRGIADPPEHEPFIDSLIEREMVLLGGPLEGASSVGYVLRCGSLADARRSWRPIRW